MNNMERIHVFFVILAVVAGAAFFGYKLGHSDGLAYSKSKHKVLVTLSPKTQYAPGVVYEQKEPSVQKACVTFSPILGKDFPTEWVCAVKVEKME